MNRLLQLAISLLLMTTIAPAQTQHAASSAATSAKWLFDYEGVTTTSVGSKEIRTDPRFRQLLRANLKQHQFLIGGSKSLATVAELFLTVYVDDVHTTDNRYATVTGCFPHDCSDKQGLLWIDTEKNPTLVLFAALVAINSDTWRQPASNFHVWIFSSQPISKKYGESPALPADFVGQFRNWFESTDNRHLVSAVLVEPDSHTIPMFPKALSAQGGHP